MECTIQMVTFTGWRGERQRQPGFCTISYAARGLRSGPVQRPPHRGASKSDLIQLRKAASHAVCSEMPEPTKSRVVIWIFRSMRHGCKVREKVHIMQRLFLNSWVTDTLATQIKITSQRLKYSPSSLFLFFPPFSASGTPRSLPHINSRKSILPNYQQELSASPHRPGMWPSVLLSHSSTDINDGTLYYTFNLAVYRVRPVKRHTLL